MSIFKKKYSLIAALCISTLSHASTLSCEIYATDGKSLGKIIFEDTPYGLLINPKLIKIPMGQHGFHIHEHPDCADHGMKAGGHFDPSQSGKHEGPYGQGHLGDLPALAVDSKGEANTPILAPRLKTEDLKGHAVMIHAGGDNYSDNPPLGGGGERIGCGRIPL